MFPSRPSGTAALARYARICDGYLTVLDDALDTAIDESVVQMVTVWPRNDVAMPRSFSPATADSAKECRQAIANYSYATAHLWMNKLKPEGGLSNRGPYLLAVARIPGGDSAVLTLDLSGMDTAPEIESAFRLWRNEIEADPRKWQSAWQPERWRLWVASELNLYGSQILDAIDIAKHTGVIG